MEPQVLKRLPLAVAVAALALTAWPAIRHLREAPPGAPAAIRLTFPVPPGAELDADGRTIRASMQAGAAALPELTRLAAAHGGGIDDISLHGARLQDVFISLTGRDLRE